MSAFISLPYADRVEILTDGATCFPSGRLLAKTCKVTASQHVPMVITGRGNYGDLEQIAEAILGATECGSFDATIDALVDALGAGSFVKRHYAYEVVIAGISEAYGPRHYFFRSEPTPETPFGAVAPFTLVDWGGMPLVGGAVMTDEELAAADVTRQSFESGLRDVGIPLFEIMRGNSKDGTPEFGDAYWIGAHIDHTVVDASGVRIERIHEWPDKLFEVISPHRVPGEGVGAEPKTMSPV